MMHEKEIRAKYETLQSDIHVSEELKRKTLAQAREAEKAGPVGVATGHPARPAHSTSGTIVDHPARPRHAHGMRRRIFVAAAAACLAVVMLGLGISVLPKNETAPASTESTPILPLGFSIQAYADDVEPVEQTFNPNQNGVLFFQSDLVAQGFIPGSVKTFREWGAYTGCIFSIQGEDITRIRIETSKGELFRYTPLQLTGDEDTEFILAARAWKPGHDALSGEYDNVNVRVPLNYGAIIRSGVSEDEMRARLYSAETTWNIDLMKRLGSVVDITVDAADNQQAEDYLFGLWINEGALSFDAILDSFSGETLTVTVWFEDGHQSTVTIELDPVDVMCKPIYTDAFGESHVIGYEFTDEIVDRNDLTDQQFDEIYNTGNYVIMHTLRGTVIDSTVIDSTVSANE
jgi:hypothetical protein